MLIHQSLSLNKDFLVLDFSHSFDVLSLNCFYTSSSKINHNLGIILSFYKANYAKCIHWINSFFRIESGLLVFFVQAIQKNCRLHKPISSRQRGTRKMKMLFFYISFLSCSYIFLAPVQQKPYTVAHVRAQLYFSISNVLF